MASWHETRETERETFRAYLVAIGRTVGHDASAESAREACPAEYMAWTEAFAALVREQACAS